MEFIIQIRQGHKVRQQGRVTQHNAIRFVSSLMTLGGFKNPDDRARHFVSTIPRNEGASISQKGTDRTVIIKRAY